jgi:hypothetical protein
MNKRLKQLAAQAGMTDDKFGMFFAKDGHNEDGVDLEKFAELIVRECIGCCDGNGEYKNHTDTEFGQGVAAGIKIAKAQIQIHFGVEE